MIGATLEPTQLVLGQAQRVRLRLRNDDQATVTTVVLRLTFSPGIDVLEGPTRLEIPRLLPGESQDVELRLLAHVLGPAHVTSGNFAYRDGWGRAQRMTGWSCALNVVKKPDEPRPAEGELHLDQGRTLSRGRWDKLDGRFVNTGTVALRAVRVELGGPLESKVVELGRVSAGETIPVEFNVHARQAGVVPITVSMGGIDEYERAFAREQPVELHVDVPDAPRTTAGTVLFLAAQPIHDEVLRLGREIKKIRDVLRSGGHHERLTLEDRPAVRRSELSRELQSTRARIVHFSGHATRSGELCFEGEDGQAEPAVPHAVARLFSLLREPVECVVLNACFTDGLADALGPHVRYVVGARGTLDDEAAFAFSSGFYQALALGHDIERAFAFGCAEVQLDPELSRQAFVLRVRGSDDATA